MAPRLPPARTSRRATVRPLSLISDHTAFCASNISISFSNISFYQTSNISISFDKLARVGHAKSRLEISRRNVPFRGTPLLLKLTEVLHLL